MACGIITTAGDSGFTDLASGGGTSNITLTTTPAVVDAIFIVYIMELDVNGDPIPSRPQIKQIYGPSTQIQWRGGGSSIAEYLRWNYVQMIIQ